MFVRDKVILGEYVGLGSNRGNDLEFDVGILSMRGGVDRNSGSGGANGGGMDGFYLEID